MNSVNERDLSQLNVFRGTFVSDARKLEAIPVLRLPIDLLNSNIRVNGGKKLNSILLVMGT